jgi:hypothetical protein
VYVRQFSILLKPSASPDTGSVRGRPGSGTSAAAACPKLSGRAGAAGSAPAGSRLYGKPDTQVGALCRELGISRRTLDRHVSPDGEPRCDGRKLLASDGGKRPPKGIEIDVS